MGPSHDVDDMKHSSRGRDRNESNSQPQTQSQSQSQSQQLLESEQQSQQELGSESALGTTLGTVLGMESESLLNSTSTSSSLDVSEQSAFVELLLMDFSYVLNRKNIPLSDNKEYMQLTELKFLLKNEIQIFEK